MLVLLNSQAVGKMQFSATETDPVFVHSGLYIQILFNLALSKIYKLCIYYFTFLTWSLTFSFLKVDAWKTHVWHDETRRPKKKEIKFNVLAK